MSLWKQREVEDLTPRRPVPADPGPGNPNETAEWRGRAVTPEQAVQAIRPGDRVFVGSACATPRGLLRALEALPSPPAGVQLVHFLTDGAAGEMDGRPRSSFRHRVFYVGRDMRSLAAAERVEYVPISLAEVPRLLETGRLAFDVALIQASPPNGDGMCSLGVSVDVTRAAALSARTVIAEITPHMPRTGPESEIPIDRIDHVVPVDVPVIEYVHEPLGPAAERIARYVARIIDDGATLQIGLGRVPNEMLRFLGERRDLGIHSDVITEPLVDLVERGVVTGARKRLHPGQVVASMAMGTRRLYDLIDGDPRFAFFPIEYVCDPAVIAANAAMVSVTQAFAIDLTGQVCADARDGAIYGGVATQPDFHRGAIRSPGGKAIICLASTTSDGDSAIRPALITSEAVAIPRAEVHYVVTEYGTAYLFGRSLTERAVALIEIAHPDHRERLLAAGVEAGLLPRGQTVRSRRAYPVEEVRAAELRDGRRIAVRPTRTGDAPALQDLFFRLRPEDVRTRFFRALRSLTDETAHHLCSVGYMQEMAFAAVIGEPEAERVVGASCYFLDPQTGLADVAYMVDPRWQGCGLGTLLQARTIEYARTHGVRGFTADVLAVNAAMLAVFRRSGCRMTSRLVDGAYEVELLFESPVEDVSTGPPSRRGSAQRAGGRSRPSRRRPPPRPERPSVRR
jgi:acyl-CoA hydrolase/RimJ/RimL family protein N-acetyltransferase